MERDVLIAGGGLNGTTLALALAQAGLSVALVEPRGAAMQAAPDFDGRSYAFSHASTGVMRALGLWPRLAPQAQEIREIRVSDGRAGSRPSPFVLMFDGAELEEGPMGHMVEDRHLRPALIEAADAAGVERIEGATVDDHRPGPSGVEATLSDGRILSARLLVGCDGGKSPTAARAGIRSVGWDYAQSSLVCALEHDRPHGGVAHQLFLPEGPLAILPLTGNRSSIVWTERRATAEALQAGSDAAWLDRLRPRFGSFLGDIRLAGKRHVYPLRLRVAERMVAPRTALLGDAAHVVHPLAGQGLNAGLKDTAALAEVLVDAARRGEDIGRDEVLDRYQRWRRADVVQLALATDAFNRLFSNDNPILRLGRDLGLGIVGALPDLRRRVMREAAGLTGDLPRLARGKAL